MYSSLQCKGSGRWKVLRIFRVREQVCCKVSRMASMVSSAVVMVRRKR